MSKKFLFFLPVLFLTPFSVIYAEVNYLGSGYKVVLEQFEKVWIEENAEGCGDESYPCAYWDRKYDDPVEVLQDSMVVLNFNKQTSFSFDGPQEQECTIFTYDGELFYITGGGTRQLVSSNGWEGFQPQEGIYEADFYFGCIHQTKNNKSIIERIFAWLKPKVAYAKPYGDYIGTIRFNITEKIEPPAPLTLPEKAAALAKELINQPDAYLWGGKGWDKDVGEFVSSANILSGYNYWNPNKIGPGLGDWDVGVGVDCSGLITWAFNRANDSLKSTANNFVKYVNANGLHEDYQSDQINEEDLKPGDAMFFDWDGDDNMDHVAIYVGESGGYDVVNAASIDQGIITTRKKILSNIDGFVDSRRIHNGEVAMSIKSGSPVDLVVSDPDGLTITPSTVISSEEEYIREIPKVLYYIEMEKSGDGNPIDHVYSPILKPGEYNIRVLPTEDAQPNDVYSIQFTTVDETILLAKNVLISDIPVAGYHVEVSGTGEIESSGPVSAEFLLEKIRQYIQSFDVADKSKKPLLALVDAIEKRLEINHKLQEKLPKHIEKLKENEKVIIERLVLVEKEFAKKSGQSITKKEITEFIKLLTKSLLIFN